MHIPERKLKALKSLRKRAKVYLLSNTNDLHWDLCLEKWFDAGENRCTDFFDKVFLSQNLKLEKPDPEIFKTVIQELGINPSETLFLDDRKENVEAAARCGLRTYHVAGGADWVRDFVDGGADHAKERQA